MATDKNLVQSTVPSLDSYTTGALIVTNLLVALVVVNALLGLAFFMLDVATTHQEAVRGGGSHQDGLCSIPTALRQTRANGRLINWTGLTI